jgi:hypothetical protein
MNRRDHSFFMRTLWPQFDAMQAVVLHSDPLRKSIIGAIERLHIRYLMPPCEEALVEPLSSPLTDCLR